MATSTPRGRGRPRRERPDPLPDMRNVCDVSSAMLEQYRSAAVTVLGHWRPDLPEGRKRDVADRLAHELAALPATTGLVAQERVGKSGPKPTYDRGTFAATLRDIMRGVGIELPQWHNAHGSCEALNEFCRELCEAAGLQWRALSARTARGLPDKGWHGGLNFEANSVDH